MQFFIPRGRPSVPRLAELMACMLAACFTTSMLAANLYAAPPEGSDDRSADDMPRSVEDADAAPFTVTLPSGVRVDLVGVAGRETSEGERQWWRPNGAPMDAPSYYAGLGTMTIEEGEVRRALLVRIRPSDGSGISIGTETRPSYSAVTSYRSGEDFWTAAMLLAIPSDRRSLTLHVGVAADPWETVSRSDGSGANALEIRDRKGVLFSPAAVDAGDVMISVSHNFSIDEQAVRVVAVDGQGVIHDGGTGSLGAADIRLITTRFHNLSPEDIREFRFQIRPYQWVAFRNVSLQPGHVTNVKGVVLHGDGDAAGDAQRHARDQEDTPCAQARDQHATTLESLLRKRVELARKHLHHVQSLMRMGQASRSDVYDAKRAVLEARYALLMHMQSERAHPPAAPGDARGAEREQHPQIRIYSLKEIIKREKLTNEQQEYRRAQIMRAIRSTIGRPAQWRGQWSITRVGDKLVIETTPQGHRRIDALLSQLREANQAEPDAAERRRTAEAGPPLSFRAAISPRMLREKTEWTAAEARWRFQKMGPKALEADEAPVAWFPLTETAKDLKGRGLIIEKRHGRRWVLLANTDPLVMRGGEDARWGVAQVRMSHGVRGRPGVSVTLNQAGGERMRALTGNIIGRPMAVLVEGEVVSIPTMQADLGREFVITGMFTEREARAMLETLRARDEK